MSKVVVVTNRRLCRTDFRVRLGEVAACHPAGIILREKDLDEKTYADLARQALAICEAHGARCILHTYHRVAADLGAKAIHLPLPLLRLLDDQDKASFEIIGASIHAPEEAIEAQALGCTYVTAGHVFATDCKKGVPPRGLRFLEDVCHAVTIPVYAIGGITPDNGPDALQAGAKGVCTMSGPMVCENAREYLRDLAHALR